MRSEAFDFSGKVVFVAGGSSGINLAIADAFAAHGATLAIASRSAERVAAAERQLQGHGGKVAGYVADVRDYAAIEVALRGCYEAFGAIDVLVSGAAGNFVAPALGMSANGFRSVVDIDLIGGFNVTRAAHAHLKRPGACVLNISAPQAANPTRYQAHV
jgi:NAD(P)-dependent dehydrogenase (short-subunit alcohol dehydrogenase family)